MNRTQIWPLNTLESGRQSAFGVLQHKISKFHAEQSIVGAQRREQLTLLPIFCLIDLIQPFLISRSI